MPEPFAGARWWKFDFHTHTPASLDTPWSGIENDKERLSPEQWLLRFMEARIDCVAVTDHNTSDWIDSLKNAYSGLASERPAGFRPLCLFPGVELSVNRGLVRLHQLRSQSRLIRFDQQPLHDASFADLDGTLIDRFCGRRHARRRDRGQGAASRPGWISPSRVPRRSRPWRASSAWPQGRAIAVRSRPSPGFCSGPGSWSSGCRMPTCRRWRTAGAVCPSHWSPRGTSSMPPTSRGRSTGRSPGPACSSPATRRCVQERRWGASTCRNTIGRRRLRRPSMRWRTATMPFSAMHGTRIRLHLYAGRIELSSPGALPNSMTVDDLAYRQTSRNETLTSLLAGLSRAVLNFASGSPFVLYEVVHVTPRQQPSCRAGPVHPGRRPGASGLGGPGPAGSAVPPPPVRLPPSVESSGRRATA